MLRCTEAYFNYYMPEHKFHSLTGFIKHRHNVILVVSEKRLCMGHALIIVVHVFATVVTNQN